MEIKRLLLLLIAIAIPSSACTQDGGHAGADMGTDAAQGEILDAKPDGAMDASIPTLIKLSLLAGAPGGAGEDDGIGLAARFREPSAAVLDGAGNLYLADSGNCAIRKVVLSTRTVTTIAGVAQACGSIDGIGSAARFYSPTGLALDGSGTLYIADRGNATIRKMVLATGEVTTFAGTAGMRGKLDGQGRLAQFDQPASLALDAGGNLYVSDTSSIRRISVALQLVTTLAGRAGVPGFQDGPGSLAQFNMPWGMAVRGTSLYIADRANKSIRLIDLTNSNVSTVIPFGSLAGPTDVALDAAANLYIADAEGNAIHASAAPAMGMRTVTVLAGTYGVSGSRDGVGTAAQFSMPSGLALDNTGTLYIVERGNHGIRTYSLASRGVSAFAGALPQLGSVDGFGSTARFNDPRGIVTDGVGNLYLSDLRNATIRKMALASGAVTTLAGSAGMQGSVDGVGSTARFVRPLALDYDGAGHLYVVDDQVVRQVAVATGAVTTLAGSPGLKGSIDAVGAAARFNDPSGIAADGGGNLYVADQENGTIRKVVLVTRAVTTLAGRAGIKGNIDGVGPAAQFRAPRALAFDGDLWVSDTHTIRTVVPATGAVTTLYGTATLPGSKDGVGVSAMFTEIAAISTDKRGNLWVAESRTIRKIHLQRAEVTTLVGRADQYGIKLGLLPARLNHPQGLAVSSVGELYLVDENSVLWVHP